MYDWTLTDRCTTGPSPIDVRLRSLRPEYGSDVFSAALVVGRNLPGKGTRRRSAVEAEALEDLQRGHFTVGRTCDSHEELTMNCVTRFVLELNKRESKGSDGCSQMLK